MDIWWLDWLQLNFEGQPSISGLKDLQAAGFIQPAQPGVWLPSSLLIQRLISEKPGQPVETTTNRQKALAAWLAQQGEWLECSRLSLKTADFEGAAEIFEHHAYSLLENPQEALDVFFWLKEMPGILLTSRPILCWLAAACAAQLGLALQVKTFLEAAENNLMSLTRFSRSEEQWRNMVINEDGVTVADLLEKIERIKSK